MKEKQGFSVLCKALTGVGRNWKSEADRQGQDLLKHPIIPDDNRFCLWFGFGSDDYLDLLKAALTQGAMESGLNPGSLEIIFWYGRIATEPRHHQIWLELKDQFTSYLCSGMTNYSGAGGSAYHDCRLACEFIAGVYNIRIDERELSADMLDLAEKRVNEFLLSEENEV